MQIGNRWRNRQTNDEIVVWIYKWMDGGEMGKEMRGRFTNDRQVGRWMKGPTDGVKNRWAYEKIKGWIG